MRRHVWRLLSAVAAVSAILVTGVTAAGTATAAPAIPSASRITAHIAGYVPSGGRHFRYVQTTVAVSPARKAPQFAEVMLGGSGVTPVFLGVKAGGGPNSVGWAIGVQPFGRGGGTLSALAPAAGDLVRMSIYYDQGRSVYLTAVDTTKGASQTVKLPVGIGTMYTAAQASVYESGYTATVATDFKLWSFTGSRVTTYSGIKGTLLGPWTTTQLVAVYSGAMVMSPSLLSNGGANFSVWRR